MIGFFPDPYPDELLYSTCARYSQRVKYFNKQCVTEELFGRKGLVAIVDFPIHLQHLINVIPSNNYSVTEVINNHTLLPFYESFLPENRPQKIRNEMTNTNLDSKVSARLGISVKQLLPAEYMRFCPGCVEDDIKKYGETYWHRIHQLGGILICLVHQCFLENTTLLRNRKAGASFQAADEFVFPTDPHFIDLNNQDHLIMLKLSQDAKWLLSQKKPYINTKIIRQRYFNLLLKQGFAFYNGKVRQSKFIKAYNDYFSPDLFRMIGRVSKNNNWLLTLTWKDKIDVTYHPIRHLLLITFLGLTAEEFFTSFVEFKPFGDPPYPCLNKTSRHYGKMIILKCDIFDNLSKDNKKKERPIGYFECNCGFIYQRIGPDKSEKDKFTYSLVREYGQSWEKKFAELWADLSLTNVEIGRRVGISQTSVGRQAIRLQLPMNTKNTRSLQGYDRHRNPNNSLSQMRLKYRQEWLEIIKRNPTLKRKQLMNKENFLYLWLLRNDSEWFNQHLPIVKRINTKGKNFDWDKIDQILSKKVEKVCDQIYKTKHFPIRVSITEIIERIGNKSHIEKRKQKLPLTDEVIERKLESLEEFMIRKIEWATNHFIEKKKNPSRNQLSVKAVVRNKTSEQSEKVQQKITQALSEIEKIVESPQNYPK